MLKNSKVGYNWIFQIIIGYKYYSNFSCLVVCVFVVVVVSFCFWKEKIQKDDFFREFTCIHELKQGTNWAHLVYEPRVLIAD